MVEQNLDIETTRNEDHYGAAIHHLSLLRNKRCLMAYMYKSEKFIDEQNFYFSVLCWYHILKIDFNCTLAESIISYQV